MNKYLLLLAIIFLSACSKEDDNVETPQCIREKIEQFSKNQNICSNATIEQYIFQDKMVYCLNIGTCGADLTTPVIDSDCNSIGFLGGLQGNIIINGESFSKAKHIRTVWRK
jgi:hypothetical protein